MASIEVKRFARADELEWNAFVAGAKNATFLFHRDYMDYHADRFTDHSLLLFQKGRLVALFVANEENTRIISHGGLSYGGLLLQKEARLEEVLSFLFHLVQYYHDHHFKEIVYKCIPSYYASYPSQEDLYALFLLKASLLQRDTSSVFQRSMPLPYQQRRRKNVKNGQQLDYRIQAQSNPGSFWNEVLIPNLSNQFDVEPVHSLKEIQLLMSRFPENIQMFEIYDKQILGGTLVYSSGGVAHAQYTSATPLGKEMGALDFLFDHLLTETYKEKLYFSFGTSNGAPGGQLNRGLVNWKEGFGTRTFAIDTYQIDTVQYSLLSTYA